MRLPIAETAVLNQLFDVQGLVAIGHELKHHCLFVDKYVASNRHFLPKNRDKHSRRWPLLGQYPINATEKKRRTAVDVATMATVLVKVSGVEPYYLRVPGHMFKYQAHASNHATSQPLDLIRLK